MVERGFVLRKGGGLGVNGVLLEAGDVLGNIISILRFLLKAR